MVPGRILVVRLSALGDVLFTLPAVEALRRREPGLAVDWVVEDKAAGVLELVPWLRRVIVVPRALLRRSWPALQRLPAAFLALAREVRELRRERYDAVLDFQGNLKSALQRCLARGRRRLGFAAGATKEWSHLLPGERVAPGDAVHRIDRALLLARALVPDLEAAPPRPALVIPAAARDSAEKALRALGLEPGAFAVLHPGTSRFGAFKRWPVERFAALADALADRHGRPVLVTSGPGEEALARGVHDLARRGGVRVCPPTRSLAELAAMLAAAAVFVGSDSAPLHLAAFLGTPCVALFGPKDPAVYGPRFAAHRVVRAWLPCSPCRRRTCPDVLCMHDIDVRMAFEAVDGLRAGQPPAGETLTPEPARR